MSVYKFEGLLDGRELDSESRGTDFQILQHVSKQVRLWLYSIGCDAMVGVIPFKLGIRDMVARYRVRIDTKGKNPVAFSLPFWLEVGQDPVPYLEFTWSVSGAPVRYAKRFRSFQVLKAKVTAMNVMDWISSPDVLRSLAAAEYLKELEDGVSRKACGAMA
jgi:hypothetical protein